MLLYEFHQMRMKHFCDCFVWLGRFVLNVYFHSFEFGFDGLRHVQFVCFVVRFSSSTSAMFWVSCWMFILQLYHFAIDVILSACFNCFLNGLWCVVFASCVAYGGFCSVPYFDFHFFIIDWISNIFVCSVCSFVAWCYFAQFVIHMMFDMFWLARCIQILPVILRWIYYDLMSFEFQKWFLILLWSHQFIVFAFSHLSMMFPTMGSILMDQARLIPKTWRCVLWFRTQEGGHPENDFRWSRQSTKHLIRSILMDQAWLVPKKWKWPCVP